jgi:hypothetical protein
MPLLASTRHRLTAFMILLAIFMPRTFHYPGSGTTDSCNAVWRLRCDRAGPRLWLLGRQSSVWHVVIV